MSKSQPHPLTMATAAGGNKMANCDTHAIKIPSWIDRVCVTHERKANMHTIYHNVFKVEVEVVVEVGGKSRLRCWYRALLIRHLPAKHSCIWDTHLGAFSIHAGRLICSNIR